MATLMQAKKKHEYVPDYAVAPGETLSEVIESLDMTQKDLATRTGLTEQTIAACDAAVRIPMTDRAESLNAGIAGSVLLWHFRGTGL